MASIKQLRARWTNSLVAEVSSILFASPRVTGDLKSVVGVVSIDGIEYLDLRGFPLSQRFKDTAFDHVDLSHCRLSHPAGFSRVSISSCRFNAWKYVGSISGTFTDCSFDDSAFSEIIGWPDSKFVRCSFVDVCFRRGKFDGSQFDSCSFRSCNITGTGFVDCQFIGCDFTEAIITEASIGDCTLSKLLNNFLYVNPYNVQEHLSFTANPNYPTVDLGETTVLSTTFKAD